MQLQTYSTRNFAALKIAEPENKMLGTMELPPPNSVKC